MKKETNMLISGGFALLAIVIIGVMIGKPAIDDYFEQNIQQVAINTCGGEQQVKSVSDDGFECK